MTLRAYAELRKEIGCARAARAMGVSTVTLWRWRKAFTSGGLPALKPKFPPGRQSVVAGVRLTKQAVLELERLIVSNGRRRAWLKFSEGPLCPAAVARMQFKDMPAPARRQADLKTLPARCIVYFSADGRRIILKIRFKGGAR